MEKRFIAYLDILGFKDLVKNNSLEDLIKIYNSAFKTAYDNVKNLVNIEDGYEGGKLKTSVISDSIIIWSESDTYNGGALIIEFTFFLMYSFIFEGIPLRGGIVYDEIESFKLPTVDSNIILGKGLVKAFEIEGKQKMASCIVDTSYIERYEQLTKEVYHPNPLEILTISKMLDIKLLIRYIVPCEKGNEEHYVLDWPRARQSQPTFDFLKNSFSRHNKDITDPKVLKKLMNTFTFIEYSWKH